MKASARSLKAIMAKAEEKLASAERELAAGFPGEASSRAYYAAFHAITAILATRGLSFSSHTQTIGAFNREFVKSGVFPAETTWRLQRLFEDRQTEDYDWSNAIDDPSGAADVAGAKALVAACRDCVERHIQEHAA